MVLLARGDYASVEFKRLKSRVSKGDTVLDSVVGECETFISGVVVNGMNSYNTFYQAYCSYAVALGISYVRNTGTTMYVSLEENEHRLNIDAVSVISLTNSEYEVLFILAHEVKHLLLRHLLKYKYMFSDEVSRVFLNMATDVEVNEGLKSDILITEFVIHTTDAADTLWNLSYGADTVYKRYGNILFLRETRRVIV